MEKAEIRRKIRLIKKGVDDAEAQIAAEKVFARIEAMAEFQRAEKVLVYHSLPDELPTHAFIERWCGAKELFLPRVNGDSLDVLPYRVTCLQPGAFNIEEPIGDDIVETNEIDLIIVPGIAFDADGNRVGRGKGYYDRLLAEARAVKIGVGYDFQLVESIDAEAHDVKVDAVVTDLRNIFIKNKD